MNSTRASIRRSAAPPATCRRAPTWSSTRGTTTRFRVPRPDLSVKLGTPNACNDCHKDKTAEWAADAVQRWHGPDRKGFQHYAEAFHDAWSESAGARSLLEAAAADPSTPGFARAGLLAELAPDLDRSNLGLARSSLADPDPMVRIGALDMLENAPPDQIWPIAAPALADPVRGVRIRADDLLAAVPAAEQPPADRADFERAAEEFIAAQRLNADRPEARLDARQLLCAARAKGGGRGRIQGSARSCAAIRPRRPSISPISTARPAAIGDGEAVLRAALAASPNDAGLHYALGLVLIRLKKTDDGARRAKQATELQPDSARNAYVYAIALNSTGRSAEARQRLAEALARHPDNRDILTALVQISQQAGDLASALDYAERLLKLAPDDQELKSFVEDLRRAAGR